MEYTTLSTICTIRRLTTSDGPCILNLYQTNPQYFHYFPPFPTLETIQQDLTKVPLGRALKDKYFLGYYQDNSLVAIVDIIEGYPSLDTWYIGLLMVHREKQGQGLGKHIVKEIEDAAKKARVKDLELGYVKENPQASSFWQNMGFEAKDEVMVDGCCIVKAKKKLQVKNNETI